jgi:hypothetical protein
MADLTEAQKLEIVSMLACFREPSAIIAHFHTEYDLELDRKQVGRYDPQRSYYAGGDKWRSIFDARRKAFLEDVTAVPIAHLGYRLQMLQQGLDAARRANNWPLVASLLEQAAKEMGGIYTSRRSLQISDTAPKTARDMSPEERQAALAEILRQAMERRPQRKASWVPPPALAPACH